MARRRRWRPKLTLALCVFSAVGLAGVSLIRLPYYALQPGLVRPTEPMVDLGGGVRDPEVGELAFATVVVDGPLSVLQALAGWLDATVAIVPEGWVLRGQSPQQNVQHNEVLMADSKQLAVHLALTYLNLAHSGGALVAAVEPASAAAGVLGVGDVVLAVGGVGVTNGAGLVDIIGRAAPGDVIVLRVLPAAMLATAASSTPRTRLGALVGQAVEVSVVLAADGADPARARLGVNARNAYDVSYPSVVSIDSGAVGGPSAGLAYALTVIDLLSAGDLTGGQKVVATGSVDLDGTIGPVGGIEQKAVAVRRSGAKLFLVPASQTEAELREARRLAGDVELVPVGSIGDALAVLAARGGAGMVLTVPGG